jgi:hypothetical protein
MMPLDRSVSRLTWKYVLLLLIVGAAGYASRRYAYVLPLPIRKRAGDALWADAVFVLVALIRPRWSTLQVATAALLIAYSIEFSQIYHAPWIDKIRSYSIGRLILGATFFWLDQLAYTIGIAVIFPVDILMARSESGRWF